MKKLIAIIEKWNYGWQGREFFDDHEDEIKESNLKLSRTLLIVLVVAAGIYAALGINCDASPYMRHAYVAFGMLFLILLALFKPLFGKAQNGYFCIFMVIELAFLFLLMVEPVMDRGEISCFASAFFALAFLLPLIPVYWMTEIYIIDLSIFCAVTFICKNLDLALIDIINSCTFFIIGVALGGYVLRSRCAAILARDIIKQAGDAEVAKAMNIANRDALTGVQSRVAFNNMETVLNAEIEAGKVDELGFIVCDCNNLKQVNDMFGHAAGDRLIVDVSKSICKIFEHSPVYRTGGDEFAVLLRGADYENRGALIRKLDMYTDVNYAGFSFAWGLSRFDKETDTDIHDVYKRADSRMYDNKRQIKEQQEQNK